MGQGYRSGAQKEKGLVLFAIMSLLKRRPKTEATSTKPVRHDGNRTGRYVSPVESGRVTPKTAKESDPSPSWYGPMILGLLIIGVLLIILNYLGVLPGSVSPWYLVVGLGFIFGGFTFATRYK